MNRVRRKMIGLAAATALGLPVARAQTRPGIARVVIADPSPKEVRESVRKALAASGFVDGSNLRIEQVIVRGAPANLVETRAAEVVASRPDVILSAFGPEIFLLQSLTRDIPIVFHSCMIDPVQAGLIESAARPGKNLTGTFHDYRPLLLKRWALFKEVRPSLKRAAWLTRARELEPPRWKNRQAAEAFAKGFLGVEPETHAEAERRFGIRIARIVVPDDATEEQLIAAVRRVRPEAIRLTVDTEENGPFDRFLISERILSDLVVRAGYVGAEGFHTAVGMVARILRGERPATMPAIQGTRYAVKVNPRLAKEMGITLPQSVMLQAEVIED